jgi:hypothetical protein
VTVVCLSLSQPKSADDMDCRFPKLYLRNVQADLIDVKWELGSNCGPHSVEAILAGPGAFLPSFAFFGGFQRFNRCWST